MQNKNWSALPLSFWKPVFFFTCQLFFGKLEPPWRKFEDPRLGATPTSKELKKLMTKRFPEISDSTHTMATLRRVRQGSSESIYVHSERLLRIAEDAYPPSCQKDQSGQDLVQRQL